MEYLPGELQRDILERLDESERFSTREVSSGFKSQRVWCTPEFVSRMYNKRIEPEDILRDYHSQSLFLLVSGVRYSFTEDYATEVSILVILKNDVLTTIEVVSPMYSGTEKQPISNTDVNSTSVESIREGVSLMFEEISGTGDIYWVDPYTTRSIMNRRMVGCNPPDVHLSNSVPKKDKYTYVHEMYLLGISIILGNTNPRMILNIDTELEEARRFVTEHPDFQ